MGFTHPLSTRKRVFTTQKFQNLAASQVQYLGKTLGLTKSTNKLVDFETSHLMLWYVHHPSPQKDLRRKG